MDARAHFSLTAVSLAGVGIGLFYRDPLLYGGFAAFAGANLFLGLAAGPSFPRRREALRILDVPFTDDEVCAHIGVFGRSGCGKTAGAFRNIFTQLRTTRPKAGIYLPDEKGDLHRHAQRIMEAKGQSDKLVLLRVEPPDRFKDDPPLRMNFLSDRSITWESYAQLVIDVAVSQGQKTTNPFFKTQGATTIAKIFRTLEVAGAPVTLAMAYQFISDKESSEKVLELLALKPNDAEAQSLLSFWTNFETKGGDEKSGIKSTTENYLAPYADPEIAATFSAIDPTVSFDTLNDGNVLCFSIAQTYLRARRYCMAFGKTLVFYKGLRRYDDYDESMLQKLPRIFIIVDEAQNSLLNSEEGLAEITALDKLRGAGVGCIYLMQSYSSVGPKLHDKEVINTFFANLNTHIVYAIKDEPGRQLAADNFLKTEQSKRSVTRGATNSSVTITKEQKYNFEPSTFGRLKKFQCRLINPEGKIAHGTIPPLSDDGESVASWYRFRFYRAVFKA
jgi:hypothetical protein